MLATRRATTDDAEAMGRIHAAAWRAAYRGLMPDAFLEGISAADRAEMWRGGLSRARERDPILVIEGDDAVLGFAAIGPAQDGPDGEVRAINIDPDHWSSGVGRRLLADAEDELCLLGHGEAILWVLPGNARARRFYARAGWEDDHAERTANVLGVVVPEVRYRRRLSTPGARAAPRRTDAR